MTPTVELAVIINSFNRCQLLREALPSIVHAVRQLPLRAAVIVFDAGSTDGSLEWLDDYSLQTADIPIHCLLPSAEDESSFSAGCNRSMAFAGQQFSGIKYCLLFETDNLMSNPAALPLAIQLLEQEQDLAAVGFTVERLNQQKTGFGSRFPTLLSFVVGQQVSHWLGLERMQISFQNMIQEVRWGWSDIVFTSPLLVRYQAWQATGGMDTIHFPFSDCDSDWCWSASKAGWRLAVLDMPGVIHDNRSQASGWSAQRVIDFHQARFRLLLKHRGPGVAFLKPILWMRHGLEASLLMVKAGFSKRARQSFHQRLILLRTVLQSYERG